MTPAETLVALDAHREAILATLDKGVSLVRAEPGAACPALACGRWALARQLRAYQVFKHQTVFDPVIRCAGSPEAARARAMRERCIAAGETWQRYLKDWSGRDVAGCWRDYRPAMLDMTTRIRRLLATERSEIAALLAATGELRARRA